MRANKTLLNRKYGHVVAAVARRQNVDLRQALDIFYKSYTYQEMRIGISDMHCRSDEYLAEEIELEGMCSYMTTPNLNICITAYGGNQKRLPPFWFCIPTVRFEAMFSLETLRTVPWCGGHNAGSLRARVWAVSNWVKIFVDSVILVCNNCFSG